MSYKIHYDHDKEQLDVWFILDLSGAGPHVLRTRTFSHCMSILIENLRSMLIVRQQEGHSPIDFYGKNTIWHKASTEPFPDDYCDDLLLIDYDHLSEEEGVFLNTNEFSTIQNNAFAPKEYDMKFMDPYVAVRFVVSTLGIRYDHRPVVFIDRDFHIEGTFDV